MSTSKLKSGERIKFCINDHIIISESYKWFYHSKNENMLCYLYYKKILKDS